MGTTTFSGPIKAGIIKHTTGSIVGEDIANTGFVEMSQVSAQLTQNALNTSAATTIIIPANSLIKGIHIFVTTVFAATNTVDVGWDYDNAGTGVVVEDALATGIAISAIGKTNSISVFASHQQTLALASVMLLLSMFRLQTS
jgi:hypothetical protein